MSLSADQRRQLIQWIAALPQPQFDGLVFSLEPPPGTLSSPPAPIGTRAAELLNWAQSVLGPGIPAVVAELRSCIESIASQKLGEFDTAFSSLQQAGDADEDCPYQGLEAFTPETRQFFYGRQGTVDLLVQKLTQFNFVPVIGASGSGKSSVVRAGLVPQLEAQGWRLLEIKPGVKPMTALQETFCSLFAQSEDWPEVYRLIETVGLARVLSPEPDDGVDPPELPQGESAKVLLVIDQFEEVFTVCPSESERRLFIQRIVEISSTPELPLAIVTTMRADFVEPWLSYGALIGVIQQQAVWLGPLEGQALVDAIMKPAEQLSYRLGEGLLELILADVDEEPNCLPLLEFALTQLWENRRIDQKVLPTAAYRDMGRLMGALNTRANQIYDGLKAPQQTWAQRLCLKLVRTGRDAKDTRQRQPLQILLSLGKNAAEQKIIRRVVNALVNGRLLTSDEGEVIDLTHEALLTGWDRFAEWRQQDRDLRRLVQRVEDAEREWQRKEQDERYLLQGGLLAEVREQWVLVKVELTPNIRCFYEKSDEKEKEKIAFLERALAEAELREQALRVMNLTSVRPYESAALAIQNTARSYQRLQGKVITPVYSGLKRICNTIIEIAEFSDHKDAVWSVAFNPNGQSIVSGSSNQTLRLCDLKGNSIGEPFLGHEAAVLSVAFSPNGQNIVSGSFDKTLRLWDLKGNPIGKPFLGHSGAIPLAIFSPDGQTIVSGSKDRTIRLWDLQGNPIGNPFKGHTNEIYSVAFSPDGQTIASGSKDRTIRLWDLQGNPIGNPFKGHTDEVWSVAFSPDGHSIVSGSSDQTVRLWNLRGKPIGEPFCGHEDMVLSVAFSPDGRSIASGSSDQTVRLWNLQGKPIGEPLQGHRSDVYSVAFSPNGQNIASGGMDQIVRLWDLRSDAVWHSSSKHKSEVWSVAFSPCLDANSSHKQTIVSSSRDKTLQLWDLGGNPIGQPFKGHRGMIRSVVFSPNGKITASGSSDQTLRLWNLKGKPIGKPFCPL